MNDTNLRQGDIVIVDLTTTDIDSPILSKRRPAIVVSNNDQTRTSPLIHVVPLTTSPKYKSPSHVRLKRNGCMNTAICEQLLLIPRDNIRPTEDWITLSQLKRIKNGIAATFDL